MKNHYHVLGLKADATQEEIKKSYRNLALKFHPDKNNGSLSAADRFTEIQYAYQILSNVQKRRTFDTFFNIDFDEHNDYLPPEESSDSKNRDYSSLYIFLTAIAIFVGAFLAIYFSIT